MAKKPTPADLVKKYNALKKNKERTSGKNAKQEVQNAIDAVVGELNDRGLNTKGTPKKAQGHNFQGCHCSAAEKLLGQHRPNCRP